MMSDKLKINDFVVRFANVNGTGSASANLLFCKAIFRMGVPVTPKNIFPSNIQATQGDVHLNIKRGKRSQDQAPSLGTVGKNGRRRSSF